MDVTLNELKERAQAWRAGDVDPQTAAEVEKLLGGTSEAEALELRDRFAAALEFGTAGLRGVVGAGPNRMNRAVVRRTTLALARYLQEVPQSGAAPRGVVVARDGRTMSLEFARDAAQVLAAQGIPALFFPGTVPTPVCAYAVAHLSAGAGVMVTASHNPPAYNGYKLYWGNGAQIIPPHDEAMAAHIEKVGPAKDIPLMEWDEAKKKGLIRELDDATERAYLEAIHALRLHPVQGQSPLNIVYTAMHGVGGRWAKAALTRAGFNQLHVVPEQQEPDARFPTVRFPNPEEKGAMDLSTALADKVSADLVLANDPDADRLAVMARDPGMKGTLRALTGNEVGVLLGHYILTQTKPLPKRPLVMTTIVSSVQLQAIAHALGADYEETLTGFKWIANRAMARAAQDGASFLFGYEEALGYTIGPLVRDKDGVSGALLVADMAEWCRARGTTLLGYLEEIQRQFGLFVAEQKSFTFPGTEGAATIAGIMKGFRVSPPQAIGLLKILVTKDYSAGTLHLPSSNVLAYELEGGARVTLRPSGTEPKIKYYFELKEDFGPKDSPAAAHARARDALDMLIQAFVKLARDRGQPA